MIQRIQTVYLLLIAGLMATMLFLPPVATACENQPLLARIDSLAAGALAIAAIFTYKNRSRQIAFCWGILGVLVLFYARLFIDLKILPAVGLQTPFVLPLFAIVLVVLAIQAIRKDEKLVHSTDRLRD